MGLLLAALAVFVGVIVYSASETLTSLLYPRGYSRGRFCEPDPAPIERVDPQTYMLQQEILRIEKLIEQVQEKLAEPDTYGYPH